MGPRLAAQSLARTATFSQSAHMCGGPTGWLLNPRTRAEPPLTSPPDPTAAYPGYERLHLLSCLARR